jgi:hypothetical protein
MHILNYINTLLKNRIPFLAFLTVYIVFSFLTYKDYGITLDEYFVYTRGQYFYTYVRGNDPTVDLSFKEKSKGNENLLFKNSSYPAFLFVFNDKGITPGGYEQYHLMNLLFASIIFWVLYEFLLAMGIRPLLALLGPILLFFTPRFLGDIPSNPKDMPYAVLYMFALLCMFLNRKMHPLLRILLIGGAIGATTSLRQVGFLLLPLYGFYRLYELKIWAEKKWVPTVIREFLEVCGMFIVSLAVVFVSYPYLHADPINRFFELLAINKDFPWRSTVLFWGKDLLPEQRPWTYLPVWLLITTPILFLGLVWIPLSKIIKDKGVFLIAFSFALNFAMYIILNPVVYDGLRHFLYLVPHVTLLASLGAVTLLTHKKWRGLILGLLVAHVLIIGYHYITLHPYEYTYFNEAVGGLRGASKNFETDYWGASDKEAMIWLDDYLAQRGIKQARIASCSKSASLGYYMPEHIDVNVKQREAEYVVCYGRFNSLKKFEGEVLHEVQRQGVTLNTVLKL